MSASATSSVNHVLPIHNPTISSSTQIEVIDRSSMNDDVYIDFPPDKLASDLIKSKTISKDGVYLRGNDPEVVFTGEIQEAIQHIKDKILYLQNPFQDEFIECPVKEIMKVVEGECYLVGSEVFLTLGKNWLVLFFKQYAENVDMQLLKQFEEESSDFDFRFKISLNKVCRQEAEKVVEHIAGKSKFKRNLTYALVSERQTFSAFHPFFRITNGEISEDSFLISTRQVVNGKIQTFDFIISRIYAGDMLSTQDIRIDIGGSKAVLCGNYQQAIIDRVLRQYRYLRITAKAWARSMVMHCEFYTHKKEAPKAIFEAVRSFCDDARSVEEGLYVLLEHYIHKHFQDNPNAIIALAFNSSLSLYRKGFDSNELSAFWKLIASNVNEVHLHTFYKTILKWACSIPFEEVLHLLQMATYIELAHHTTEGRSINTDCIYIVTHLESRYVATRKGGFSILIPYAPVQTLQAFLKKANTRKSDKISGLIRSFITFSTVTFVENNILCANFAQDAETNAQLQKLALTLAKHRDHSLRLVGFQLAFLGLQLNPASENLEKVLQHYPLVIELMDSNGKKAVHQLFQKISKNEKFNVLLKLLDSHGITKKGFLDVLAQTYPQVLLETIKIDKDALTDHPNIIESLLTNLLSYQNELPKEFFQELATFIHATSKEGKKEGLSKYLVKIIEELISKNKVRTASLLLLAISKEKILNGLDAPLIWLKLIDKIASTHPQDAQRLILLSHSSRIWSANQPIPYVSIPLIDCIAALLETNLRRNVDAAITLTAYIRCNITIVQTAKFDALERKVNEVKSSLEKDLGVLERDFEELKEKVRSLNLTEELFEVFNVLLKKARDHDLTFTRIVFLDHTLRPLIAKFPIPFFRVLNELIEYFSKRNEEIVSMLMLPFHQIIVDGKCPCEESVVRFIQHFTQYILITEPIENNVIQLLKSNARQFLNILKEHGKVELVVQLLRTLNKHNILAVIPSQEYLSYLRMVLKGAKVTEALEVFSIAPIFSDENGKSFLLIQIEFIDMLISNDEVDHLEKAIGSFIQYLSSEELSNLHLSETFLIWVRYLIRCESYELASKLLNILENSHLSFKSQLCDLLKIAPDNILKLSSAVFCRTVNAMGPADFANIPLRKVNSLALHLLRSQCSRNVGDLAFDILEKRPSDLDELLIKAMEYTLNLKSPPLCIRAFSLYQNRLPNFESIPQWGFDSNLAHRWLRAWECSMKIVNLYIRNEKQYLEKQLHDALTRNSSLNTVLNGLSNPSIRRTTLKTLIQTVLETYTLSDPSLVSKCENLLHQVKGEYPEFQDWESLEVSLMERYFNCKNIGLYIRACDFTIDLIKKYKENFSGVTLVEAAISGANSLSMAGKKIPYEFSMLLRFVKYVGSLTPRQLEPIKSALNTHMMSEILIFRDTKIERYHGKKIGEYRRLGFRIREPSASTKDLFIEDIDKFIWNYQIFRKNAVNAVCHPLRTAAKLRFFNARRATVLLHNTLISEVRHPKKAFLYGPILLFTMNFTYDLVSITFATKLNCRHAPLEPRDHFFAISVLLMNLYLLVLFFNTFVGFYKAGVEVKNLISPKKEKKRVKAM